LPITITVVLLLGVAMLGWLAVTVSHSRSRTRRRVGEVACHPDDRPDDRAGTSSHGLPAGVSIPVRAQTGLTQQHHPTSSPASTPVGVQPANERQQRAPQPSNERQQLPLTPAAGPTDSEHEEAITTGRVAVHPSHKSGATPAAGPLAAEPRQNPFGGARRT
jgi:hypothetical protein